VTRQQSLVRLSGNDEGSGVGRVRIHLILRSMDTVADFDVRVIRSHGAHFSAVFSAQESLWRRKGASHLRVTRVKRDGLNADVSGLPAARKAARHP
jgi:hypothetical protein